MSEFRFTPQPEPAGAYDLGGVYFYVTRKPNALQRFLLKHLLGLRWVDKIPGIGEP